MRDTGGSCLHCLVGRDCMHVARLRAIMMADGCRMLGVTVLMLAYRYRHALHRLAPRTPTTPGGSGGGASGTIHRLLLTHTRAFAPAHSRTVTSSNVVGRGGGRTRRWRRQGNELGGVNSCHFGGSGQRASCRGPGEQRRHKTFTE